ncbi:MAG: hypothetical protein H6605_04275 [Flavobacteriales bacterium]|nr:hypothetical protein [Flavobacteriales bacterium]
MQAIEVGAHRARFKRSEQTFLDYLQVSQDLDFASQLKKIEQYSRINLAVQLPASCNTVTCKMQAIEAGTHRARFKPIRADVSQPPARCRRLKKMTETEIKPTITLFKYGVL